MHGTTSCPPACPPDRTSDCPSDQPARLTDLEPAIDRYQYLIVLGLCVLCTLPLELVVGARVWRQPRRLATSVLPVVVVFVVWDLVAIERGHWWFSERYTTGWLLPGGLPVEEVAFFVVVPICGLLTYEAVKIMWPFRTRTGGADA